ncbi:MAG: thiamine-phosphate kinase [Akkermansiaceae bacterium]
MKSVIEIGEDQLVHRLLAQLPPPPQELHVGPGDDCAVVPFSRTHWQLLKTDAIVEGVHFLPTEDYHRVGWKAIARVVSDFAAMGGTSCWFLVTIGIPENEEILRLERLYQGMSACATKYHATIVGGETTRVARESGIIISVAATGKVRKSELILRSTAKCHDMIFVTGSLGGSLAGRHLDIQPRVNEAQWLAKHHYPSAMMDLSDGLAKDMGRLARSSSLGYQIDIDALPLQAGCDPKQALQDGEDYELLFTVPSSRVKSLAKRWHRNFPDLALSCIGQMVDSEKSMHLTGGWDHFQEANSL